MLLESRFFAFLQQGALLVWLFSEIPSIHQTTFQVRSSQMFHYRPKQPGSVDLHFSTCLSFSGMDQFGQKHLIFMRE